jgi:hypothetical protein
MRRALAAVCFVPLAGFAADLEFAGGLERLTQESIQIRLADGNRIVANLAKTGELSKESINARIHLADEVQITCKPKDPKDCAELKSIRFLRPPTPKERFLILGSPTAASSRDAELERVRQVNLERAKHMPSFIADETAKRYTSSRKVDPPVWKQVDTIESEIVFKSGEPTREHIRINGKPLNKPRVPGLNWSPFFGTEIKMVFDPQCPTELAFEGREEAYGKQLLAYVFTSPPDGCGGWWEWGRRRYNAGRTGRVLVEDPVGSLVRYEEKTTGYPKDFPGRLYQQAIVWEYVKIGDASDLLPVSVNFELVFASEDSWRVTVDYKNHRRFEAATTITFQ